MPWPFTYGTASSPVAASTLDTMFNQTANMTEIPCSVTGTNALSLTPLPNCPALTAYAELGGYRFRAAGNSSGAVTAQYNGLGFLNVYHADGVTQCGTGDLVTGFQYVVRFSQALNSGAGGFFLESPALAAAGTQPWGIPGGRLSFQSNVPVMTTNLTNQQVIYYVPYNHQWVPIYNGANVQPYLFSSPISNQSGPSLNMGGAANFPTGPGYDVFCYLNAGVPSLCAVAWTNATTRAVTLATIGGVLTNSGSTTAQNGPNTSFTLPQNQGTFLGSFAVTAQGSTQWTVGASTATGGTPANFFLCNYYNKVQFTSAVGDGGAVYNYTAAAARTWRGNGGSIVSLIQCDSERAVPCILMTSLGQTNTSASTSYVGIGFNTQSSFAQYSAQSVPVAATATLRWEGVVVLNVAVTGVWYVAALEQSDGTNANAFNWSANQTFQVSPWL